MSIREELRRLVDLQVAELRLREIDRALAALPEERAACRRRVEEAHARVAEAERRRQESQGARRQLERQLQEAETQLDRYREHELQVKTNEQLWALQEEMRQVEARIAALEEQILEEMERADALVAAVERRRAEAAEREREADEQLAALAARERALQERREQAEAQIGEMARAIDADVLARYERVKAVRSGVGVAEALDGTCLACNFRLRPQLYLEVLNMETLLQCDHCKRILFNRDALQLPAELQIACD